MTVVQISALGQKDATSLFVLSDGILGLAHALSSFLIMRPQVLNFIYFYF